MSEAQEQITEKITSGQASNSNIGLTDSSPEDKDKSGENLSGEKTCAGEQTKCAPKCQENVAPATTGKCHETATARTYTGFDAVVREERKNRKLTFGPNVKKVIKPSNILIDIYGVICSWNFAKTLKTYALKNMGSYLADNVNDKKTKDTIGCLREQAAKDKAAGIELPQIASTTAPDAELVDTATASILWMMEKKHKSTSVSRAYLANIQ